MTRDERIEAIVEHRLNKRTNVTNPTAIRSLIRGDLSVKSDRELELEHDSITGKQSKPTSKSVTQLDLAISTALQMLGRFTEPQIIDLLVADYGAELAGRALALAIEKLDATEPELPNSLAEYRRESA